MRNFKTAGLGLGLHAPAHLCVASPCPRPGGRPIAWEFRTDTVGGSVGSASTRPDAQLWVAGDGDEAYVQGLHALAAECDLSDHVRYLGFVLAEQGPAAVQETFSLERVGEQVRSLYEQALAAARSHPCCFRLQFCAAHRSAYALAHRAGAVPSAGMALVRVAVPLWVEERSPSIPHASSPIGAYFQRRRSGVCAGWSFARYLKRYTPICHPPPDTSL